MDLVRIIDFRPFQYDQKTHALTFENRHIPAEPPEADTYRYMTPDRRLSMSVTLYGNLDEANHTVQAWTHGMEFLRHARGFDILYNRDPATPLIPMDGWVEKVRTACMGAPDKVFYVMREPFVGPSCNIHGMVIATANGDFISISELAYDDEITDELVLGMLSGDIWKEPLF
jgi:hypothetical protein